MKSSIDFDVIPQKLKSINHWICWAWIERDGKKTKPPFNPDTGFEGNATDPAIWKSFEKIQDISKCPDYDGIGFAVQDTGLTGVDLDNCINKDGEIAEWAQRIVGRLKSYTEITPSGNGLRIWVKGTLPKGRRRKGPIEMYDSGRYFTVTGRHLPGTPTEIGDRQTDLDLLHAEVFAEEKPEPARKASRVIDLHFDDDELLKRAFNSVSRGDKIRRLFNGDMSDHADDSADGFDHSAADMALCSDLAFWFGGNIDAMDRVFRRSGLMREKWERASYREGTLRRACEKTNFYNAKYGCENGDYEPPPLIEQLQINSNGHPPHGREPGDDEPNEKPEGIDHRTDLGNARILVDMHDNDIKYIHPWEKWIMWRGSRWEEDKKGYVTTLSRNVIRKWHKEWEKLPYGPARDKLYRYAMSCESNARIGAMVSQARYEPNVAILPDELDANPWQLNCTNGTVDLATGKLSPHVRSDMITKTCNAKFDPDAKCPKFIAFLDKIMDSNAGMMSFLKRATGYTAVGVVYEHVLFFLHGDGANGKSTYVNTIQYVLGDYGITINAEILMENKFTPHSTGITDIMGKRWVSTIEVQEGKALAESLVKSLTGNDKIRARRLYEDHFEFTPTHTIWLAANHAPDIKGQDLAIWRRIKKIPFNVTIAEKDQDKSLPFALQDEASGILNWIIEGCIEWQKTGLSEPKEVTDATKEYKNESDELKPFLDECVMFDKSYKCSTREVYEAYHRWAIRNGIKNPMTSNMFGRLLNKRGYKGVASDSTQWRHGMKLKSLSTFSPNRTDIDISEATKYLVASLRGGGSLHSKVMSGAIDFNISEEAIDQASRVLRVTRIEERDDEHWSLS